MDFGTIKRFYDSGLWTIGLVKMAVRKGVITKAQYKKITGKQYV